MHQQDSGSLCTGINPMHQQDSGSCVQGSIICTSGIVALFVQGSFNRHAPTGHRLLCTGIM